MLQNEHPFPSEAAPSIEALAPILRRAVMSPADFEWTIESSETLESEFADE